jgi:putative OPT family oligopeptide transporter
VVLRELSLKAVLLGVLLSVVLAGANAYLGLFAGMTVSASIPAAVLAMALLGPLHATVLENNLVQTAASAGESLAAGAVFTLPALVLLGAWSGFHYLETTLIVGLGGLLGVLFTIPLRRALIVERPLRYPEGVATAEVLRVGMRGGTGIAFMAWATLIGGVYKLGDTGLRLWQGIVERATFVGGGIAYAGTNLSPALVAVGYIVGLNVAVLIFIGGAANWLVIIPILAATRGVPADMSALDAAGLLWSTQTRYVGVGAMLVGGIAALAGVRHSLLAGVRSGIRSYQALRSGGAAAVERTERDLPMPWVMAAIGLSVVPLFFIFWHISGVAWVALVMAVLMLVAGFLFAAVAGYMAGLVGSSNNPISGVTIATILSSSLLLVAMLGRDSRVGPAAAIMIGAVVCSAAAIAGDNMQDLKAGRLVGSTPYRQQIMQVVGVIVAALVMAPLLDLLLSAYGIGVPTEAHPRPLRAPQATLMASVAHGVFRGRLPWDMVGLGVVVGLVVVAIDGVLSRRKSAFRVPVLAVAVGIYLPFELAVPIFLGGLIAWAAARRRKARSTGSSERARAQGTLAAERHGLLFGAGLITGEALMGIVLALPIVVTGRTDALALFKGMTVPSLGFVLLGGVMAALYFIAGSPRPPPEEH